MRRRPLGKLTQAVAALYAPAGASKPRNGFDLSHLYQPKNTDVWPENWPVFTLFCSACTQWRTGMSGATGLDYNVLFRLLDMRYSDREEWQQAFEDLQLLESAALAEMKKNE